jgi:hypothetical protein
MEVTQVTQEGAADAIPSMHKKRRVGDDTRFENKSKESTSPETLKLAGK